MWTAGCPLVFSPISVVIVRMRKHGYQTKNEANEVIKGFGLSGSQHLFVYFHVRNHCI